MDSMCFRFFHFAFIRFYCRFAQRWGNKTKCVRCMQYFSTNMRKSLSFSITNLYSVGFFPSLHHHVQYKIRKNYVPQRHHKAEWDFHGFLLIETIGRASERAKIGNTIQQHIWCGENREMKRKWMLEMNVSNETKRNENYIDTIDSILLVWLNVMLVGFAPYGLAGGFEPIFTVIKMKYMTERQSKTNAVTQFMWW